jgi:glycine/D-amino acid oxidase-like deaminating enzyme/nitrite reductase/ring-hydroxylating ferredoxin subunit
MKGKSGKTRSLWQVTAGSLHEELLAENQTADVCVVGAGIAGMTTAYVLAREGRKVIVLEGGAVGSGETGRTTAHLSNALDDRYFELERLHGVEGARHAAESHTAAIEFIEATIAEEGIDCDFERLDGYLFVPPGDSTDILERELDAARRAGLEDVELVDRAPLGEFDTGACLRFPRQAQFHPLKYLGGLHRSILRLGGRIFTGTRVEEVVDGAPARVRTSNGREVIADGVVVATNTPMNDRVTMHTKQAAYRTYVIGARVPAGSVMKALYWDTPDPYHYVRIHSADTHDVLIVGGEDHKTGQEDDAPVRWSRLESWVRERFVGIEEIEYLWSGQVLEPVDYLAFIGLNPGDKSVYIATGDSGHGMTHGTIAGLLLPDLIASRHNNWATLYDPSRITLKAAGEFTRENLNVAAQYGDWLTSGEVDTADDIPRRSGAVLRRGAHKIAVYRDDNGAVHERSAVCTHLGCIVRWNSAEHTWDCPCHGSRFGAEGNVINGPARADLAHVEPEIPAEPTPTLEDPPVRG